MKKLKFTRLQIITHMGAWLPLLWLLWDNYAGNLSINPIQELTQRTGKYALIMLVLSLAITPLITLSGFRQLVKLRRPLGLYAFMYAAIHFFIFIGLDYAFDWNLLRGELFEKRYILVGLGALLILSALAITSFKWWMKRLGKDWKRLHRLVYLASVLVIVHFGWSQKGDFLRLQGDVGQPLAFGLAVALLLLVRIPPVRRRASRLHQALKTRLNSLQRRSQVGRAEMKAVRQPD
jgi:sulfoxide reductase heme-binding subunit YedZ